ncbi:lysosomal acid phosphatase isoform X1 [Brienomyrus brachyistius]|uniref:lysosomal acid phosphatase isoform X1 n=1 Tax=Brienomyrus brachyistius TaxID=42636 RepID=UPI0020B2C9C3|nr:lysosomal acid phosphatase isoform X1 [Brienomyrus brachyistius]
MELRMTSLRASPTALVFLQKFLIIVIILDAAAGERTRLFVTVLYRHGDRSPVRSFPTDPHQESAWPQGFGQLTQEGMRQHFQLGQSLRRRYDGFLNATYNRHEIMVRSTDYDRTLMSAEAHLAGLYPPNGTQIFNPNLAWQPIPIHTVPQAEERLLSFPLRGCKKYERLMNETKKTDVFINMTNTYRDFLAMVRNKTGLEQATIESVWGVHDTLFCEAKHNLTLPPWVTPEVMEKLGELKDFGFRILFELYKREEKCRLQGGLLLDQILKNISAVAANASHQPLKMIMYSAHDTTIVALQSALNVFNGKQPPYASCHIFELFQEDNGSFSIAMFYWNDSRTEPYPLVLPGCDQYCPLVDFVRLTKPVIPVNWKAECEMPFDLKDTEMIIGLTVCGCLLLILFVLLLTVLCRQKGLSSGYSSVTNEGDDHS